MRSLGFKRREGLFGREVVLGVVDGVVDGRKRWRREREAEEEASGDGGGNELTRRASSQMMGHNGSSNGGGGLVGRSTTETEGTVAVKMDELLGQEGNPAVLTVLKRVLESYGVDLEDDVFEPIQSTTAGGGKDGSSMASVRRGWLDEAELTGVGAPSRDRFGWPELQLKCLRDAIGISETLPGTLTFLSRLHV